MNFLEGPIGVYVCGVDRHVNCSKLIVYHLLRSACISPRPTIV